GLPFRLGQTAVLPIRAEQRRRALCHPFQLRGRVFERKGNKTLEGHVCLRPEKKFVRRRRQFQSLQQWPILEPRGHSPGRSETDQWLVNDVRWDLPGFE